MTKAHAPTDSRLAREFLLALQRARANRESVTVRWHNASADDISLVSAFLDADIRALIEAGITELKGMK